MVERMLAERLHPSLLDRLTDTAPDSTSESAAERVIDLGRLREIIQRDIAWLLNTSNMEATHDLDLHPNVARSVLNYGILDLAGSVRTRNRAVEIRQAIRRAIEAFEPRILPQTIEVAMQREESGTGAVISFDIRGELWAEPLPIDIYLRTALDVTTGEVTVNRQG